MSATDKVIGQVKWFNNKAGYGFITIKDGSDVFAHYSNIASGDSQYKYLIQGEYVEFSLAELSEKKEGTQHEFQAMGITGVNGGTTMCEVRRLNRETRQAYRGSADEEETVVPIQRTASVEARPPRARAPRVKVDQTDSDGFKVIAKKSVSRKA